jgi:nucleotide-binding universal stress UspA family protein
MIKSIVVAADASAHAVAAREQAVWLARAYQARVVGLGVLDVRLLEMPPYLDYSYPFETIPISQFPVELMESFRKKMEHVLVGFKEAVEQAGVQCDTRLEEGVPAEVIAELADSNDLLVVGKRGEHARWGKETLGSTTELVIRRATVPVLLADEVARPMGSMVLLYDGSHPSNQALKLGIDIATHTGVALRVLSAAASEEEAAQVQEEAREYAAAFDLDVGYRVREGDVNAAVFAELDDEPADLVLLGKKGHSLLHKLLLGSTAERLMRELEMPVLLVP